MLILAMFHYGVLNLELMRHWHAQVEHVGVQIVQSWVCQCVRDA